MKPIALTITVALATLCSGVLAEEAAQATPKAKEAIVADAPNPSPEWTFFQVGFFPGAPKATNNSTVRGIKMGFPMSAGDNYVCGIEPSFIYSGTNYVDGIQGAMFGAAVARKVNGIQGTWFGYVQAREVNGMQCAIGPCVVKTLNGWQPSCASVTLEKSNGFQIAFANVANAEFNGFQAAAVNVANQELCGFQLGAVNYAHHNGVQFGVINIIKDAWIPVLPLVNFSCKDEAAK